MDKITMNNEIVLMRRAVKKARFGVVSKLVKEIKLLNGRKHGDEKVIDKCHRKASKLMKEIKALKKMKNDKISKFAITNKADIKQVLSNPSANIKTRIMIRLASHKALKDETEKFRSKFPDYQAYFDLVKQKKMKKKKENSNDETINDEKNIKPPKKIDNSEAQTIIKSNSDSEVESCDSDSDHQDETTPELETNQPVSFEISTKTKKKKDKVKLVQNQVKTTIPVSADVKLNKCSTVKVVSKLATVKRFNVADDVMENIGIEQPITDDAESNEDMMQVDQKADSLLNTQSEDNNYLHATRKHDENDVKLNSSRNHYTTRNFFTNIDKKPKFNHELQQNSSNTNGKFTRSLKNTRRNDQNNRTKYERIEDTKKQQVKTKKDMGNEDLHPSWAARKKQQDILKQGFQGKKIVFSDD